MKGSRSEYSHNSEGRGNNHHDRNHSGPLVRFESNEWCGIPRGSKIVKVNTRHYGKYASSTFYHTTEDMDRQMESDRMDVNKNREHMSY